MWRKRFLTGVFSILVRMDVWNSALLRDHQFFEALPWVLILFRLLTIRLMLAKMSYWCLQRACSFNVFDNSSALFMSGFSYWAELNIIHPPHFFMSFIVPRISTDDRRVFQHCIYRCQYTHCIYLIRRHKCLVWYTSNLTRKSNMSASVWDQRHTSFCIRRVQWLIRRPASSFIFKIVHRMVQQITAEVTVTDALGNRSLSRSLSFYTRVVIHVTFQFCWQSVPLKMSPFC